MISVNASFIFFSAIVFLGFILNGLFSKTKITNIIPLMIIGYLVGPIFGIINTGSGSIVAAVTPYFTALAISFILFDVGLRIDFNKLKKLLLISTIFTLVITLIMGVIFAILAYFIFGWSIIISLIFGFAIAGPSAIVIPTIVNMLNLSDNIKTLLIYESIASDSVTLIFPLLLFGILFTGSLTSSTIVSNVVYILVGSIDIAVVSALFWLYILKKFKSARLDYGWMLTIAMVVATYGISQQIGVSGTITIFIFGLLVANLGAIRSEANESFFSKKFGIPDTIDHIRGYQKEIVFFASTFFFVYLGTLFNITVLNYSSLLLILIAAIFCMIMVPLRYVVAPITNRIMSKEKGKHKTEKNVISFSVARGLTVAVIATLTVTYGLNIPNFVDMMFLIIFFSNLIESIGVFFIYKKESKNQKDITHVQISNT